VETAGVVGIYAVAPLGGATRHLLAATRSGPRAFPTDPRANEALSQFPGAEQPMTGRAAE
jgi:hypothetical protein